MTRSAQLFEEARRWIPGGVNSPVRAFAAIGGSPRFIARADGAYLTDVDGNRYIDYVCSWGPMLLGHNRPEIREAVSEAAARGLSYGAATELEVEMARLVCRMVPGLDMVRMVNSGTEAVMSAIRAARGYTRRDKIIKFQGCYHGHSDCLLVKAGSGVMTAGMPGSAGVPAGCTSDTLTAEYNDLAGVEALFKANPDSVACVVVEPVAANMGVVLPSEGFLQGLRQLCDRNGSLLLFDEVITGFRLSPAGAVGYFGVQPDLMTFGKIIGAGMPVGAYGGRRAIMEQVSPLGPVYQAGTLSGNPVAMAAGLAQLTLLRDHPQWYGRLHETADRFFAEIQATLAACGLPYPVNHLGSLGCIFFTDGPVTNYPQARRADTEEFGAYCRYMLDHGVYCAPSQFEAMFLSTAHGDGELNQTLEFIRSYFQTR